MCKQIKIVKNKNIITQYELDKIIFLMSFIIINSIHTNKNTI